MVHGFILGCVEVVKEFRLANIPNWSSIRKDRDDDCVIHCAPLGPAKAVDGVPK